MYEVDDFVTLRDTPFALRRDASASRLRLMTEDESLEHKVEMEKRLGKIRQETVSLRVRGRHGQIHDVRLPFSALEDIVEIQLLAR